MTARVGLLGWNGRLNAGDDAMTVMIADTVRAADPGAELHCLGEHGALPRILRDMGVRGNRGFNASLRLPGVRSALLRHVHGPAFLTRRGLDLLIIGGGSILRDHRTIGFYLDLVARLRARNPAAKVLGFGLSVGPFTQPRAEAACQRLLARMTAICVRDVRSEALVQTLAPDTPVHRHADPAFHQFRKPPAPAPGGKKTHLGIMLRAGAHLPEQAAMLDWLARLDPARVRLSFLSFCAFARDDDAAFARSHLDRFQGFETRVTTYDGDLDRLAGEIAGCDRIVSVRLHGMIHALCLQRPVMYLPYHAKLDDIAAECRLDPAHRITADTYTRPPEDVLAAIQPVDSARMDALARDAAAAGAQIRAALGGAS